MKLFLAKSTKRILFELFPVAFVSIIHLFFSRCPSTIRKAVITVVINSFNRCVLLSERVQMIEIRFIHVSLKFFKIFPKYFYSTTTVIIKIGASFVITSVPNAIIYATKWCITHAMSQRVLVSSSPVFSGFYRRNYTPLSV